MKILALEFSSNERSVAVAEGNASGFTLLGAATEAALRGSTGMVLVDRALREAHLRPADIDLLVVGLGPGSYAGIRSAIAIAQGWQLARNTRLIGVGSVEVLAREAQIRGIYGDVTIIIDAQRKELYVARYRVSEITMESIQPLQIFPADLKQGLAEGVVAGPGAAQLTAGALDLYPAAATLARLAATRSGSESGEHLEPIYLRETSFVKAPPSRLGNLLV